MPCVAEAHTFLPNFQNILESLCNSSPKQQIKGKMASTNTNSDKPAGEKTQQQAGGIVGLERS